ncbi:MAG: M20/M25/M40 family metallo-hydrolase [Pseudomonadota bacterium]
MHTLPADLVTMTKTLLAVLLVTAFSSGAFAHDEPVPTASDSTLAASLVRIRDAALGSDYAYRQTAMLTDEVGHRLSGSRGAALAVQRVADELRALGLNVTLEPVKVPHWVRGEEAATLIDWNNHAEGLSQKLAITALGGSVATPKKGLTAEVLPVRDFVELAALGREKVAGRIVLFTAVFDEQMAAVGRAGDAYGAAVVYRGTGAAKAAALGAVASLNRSVGPIGNHQPHTGALRYAEGVTRIPAAAIAAEDCLLIERLAAKGKVTMQLTLTPQSLPDADSFNVVADLKGRELPEEIVLVSGHLDSWDLGTGAQDDATGVAAAMQVAATLKALGLIPRRTLRVVAWMNEENGLKGGTDYAASHAEQISRHLAAIEMDFGAGHPTGIAANVPPAALPLLKPVSEALAGIGAGIIDFRLGGVGADIGPLNKLGVPGFAPLTDGREYFTIHHTAADTLDKVNPRHLAENAAVLSVLAYALAEGEALPRLPVTP